MAFYDALVINTPVLKLVRNNFPIQGVKYGNGIFYAIRMPNMKTTGNT